MLQNIGERFHKILNSTSQWFWVIGEDLKILDINDGFCTMTGYNKEEITGRHIYDFFDSESRKVLEKQAHTIKDTKHRTYDVKLLRKDGTSLPIKLESDNGGETRVEILQIS